MLRLSLLILAGCMVVFNVYSLVVNADNHTGFPLAGLSDFYLACSFMNLVLLIGVRFKRLPVDASLVHWLVIVSQLGVANIAAFETFDIMMEYEAWIRKGMPDKPSVRQ